MRRVAHCLVLGQFLLQVRLKATWLRKTTELVWRRDEKAVGADPCYLRGIDFLLEVFCSAFCSLSFASPRKASYMRTHLLGECIIHRVTRRRAQEARSSGPFPGASHSPLPPRLYLQLSANMQYLHPKHGARKATLILEPSTHKPSAAALFA